MTSQTSDRPLTRIAVIMTVFSRAELTRRILRALLASEARASDVRLLIFVVDDGSTDSTPEVLATEFAERVTTITSPGGLFWARGMHLAFTHAMREQWDHLLWVNDDIDLDPDWLERLLPGIDQSDVVIGSMRSAAGDVSYGGLRRSGRGPASMRLVEPSSAPQHVDAFQGNLVLMRRSVAEAVGGPDPVWSHGYADIDFGNRARRAGFALTVAPGFFGTCDVNPVAGTWMDDGASRRVRLTSLFGRKGQPPRDHWRFMRRYGGLAAPAWFAASYLVKIAKIATTQPLEKAREALPVISTTPHGSSSKSSRAVIVASAGRAVLLGQVLRVWDQILDDADDLIVSVPDESHLPAEVPDRTTVVLGHRGSSVQRNRAIDAVRDGVEFVYFFDDDCIPADDYTQACERIFHTRPDVVGIDGNVLADGAGAEPITFTQGLQLLAGEPGEARSDVTTVGSLYGCNFAVRASGIGELRFDEDLPLYGWLEDEDFTRRIGRRGRLVRSQGARCVHLGAPSGGRRNYLRYGYSQIANPLYLHRKGTLAPSRTVYLVVKPLTMNLIGVIAQRTDYRRGCAKGNLLALRDLLRGRLQPKNILDLKSPLVG